MTDTEDTSSRLKSKHPADFDGDYGKYCSWIREIKTKILVDKIKTDEEKILCTLQYMKSGTALELRDAFLDKATEDPDAPTFGTWKDFLEILDARFTDHHYQTRAREKVENFTQDRLSIQEFIIRLEMLFTRAQLADEGEKTRILKKNVNPNILTIVYNSDILPRSYDAWKTKIIKVGSLQEDLQQIQKQRTTKTPPYHTTTAQSKYNIIVPTPPADKKTGTGVTYGGRGQPMEIDRLKNVRCFNCDEFGHFRDKCPKPKKEKLNVRELWEQLEDDEKEEFFVEIRAMERMSLEEKDF
jgi:hypothetical protein